MAQRLDWCRIRTVCFDEALVGKLPFEHSHRVKFALSTDNPILAVRARTAPF
jgi:hypothetical protein